MSLSLPSVSVVMPNFNHGKYIRTALEAMVTQSVPPLEIIVVDDASTDDSWAIIQELATRHACIQPVRNKSNQGVVSAMNLGLRLAQGDYVHFGAADDQIYPGLYEKSLTLLRDHPLASFSCTIGDWHEVTTGFNWHMGVGMAEHPSYLAPRQLVGLEQAWRLFIPSHTALVRRGAALEVGGFIPELKWHCDWFLLYTSAFRHGMCHVPEPLGASTFLAPLITSQAGATHRLTALCCRASWSGWSARNSKGRECCARPGRYMNLPDRCAR